MNRLQSVHELCKVPGIGPVLALKYVDELGLKKISDLHKIRDQLNKPDRYDDKVRQADGVIQQIFEMLETRGYLDDAVVVITGCGVLAGARTPYHGVRSYPGSVSAIAETPGSACTRFAVVTPSPFSRPSFR